MSKPRPWHKLTDKGRDAFRRIFGWLSDDLAIDLLCQLSPRKVAQIEKLEHPKPESLIGDPMTQMMMDGGVGQQSGTGSTGGMSMVNVMKMAMGGAEAGGGGARAAKRSENMGIV